MQVLLLHPGAMGASIGAALVSRGHFVSWVAEGRSAATASRASEAGLRAVDTLAGAVADAEVAISVCPPDAAVTLAKNVQAAGSRLDLSGKLRRWRHHRPAGLA